MTCWTGFGNLIDGQHPVWLGDFTGSGRTQVLFYYGGDGNWWLGDTANGQLGWSLVGNTGRPCAESILVHFKTLVPLTAAVSGFIDQQFADMNELLSQSNVPVYRGTTEDLSGDPNVALLADRPRGGSRARSAARVVRARHEHRLPDVAHCWLDERAAGHLRE